MALFQQSTLEHEAEAQRDQRLLASHVIDARAAGLRPDAVDELAEHGARPAIGLADTVVYGNFELDPYAAKVVTGESINGLLDLGVDKGDLDAIGSDQVALSDDAASGLGVDVGERVHLRLGDGTVHEPRVVARLHPVDRVCRRGAAVDRRGRPSDRPTRVDGADRSGRRAAGEATTVRAFSREHPAVDGRWHRRSSRRRKMPMPSRWRGSTTSW